MTTSPALISDQVCLFCHKFESQCSSTDEKIVCAACGYFLCSQRCEAHHKTYCRVLVQESKAAVFTLNMTDNLFKICEGIRLVEQHFADLKEKTKDPQLKAETEKLWGKTDQIFVQAMGGFVECLKFSASQMHKERLDSAEFAQYSNFLNELKNLKPSKPF
jgi:hypothetical protein